MANHRADITGRVYGRLTAIRPTRTNKHGQWLWLYQCECGNTVEKGVLKPNSCNAGANGCGCKTWKTSSHDYYKTHKRLTWVHRAIKQRCLNKNCKDYPHYGGRGITICDEWLSLEVFCDWAIESGYREGLTIERINVNDDYCPKNCTWVRNELQPRNRTISVFYELNGETGDLRYWSDKTGINFNTLKNRINNYGWTLEKSISTPVRKK